MTEPDGSGISARLLRLPGQLLLALINATAILVIVAAIVALVAMARINRFAENVAATMTEAVLSKVDLPQKDVLANIRSLTTEVRTLGNTLREIKAGEHPVLQSELAQLKEALTAQPAAMASIVAMSAASRTSLIWARNTGSAVINRVCADANSARFATSRANAVRAASRSFVARSSDRLVTARVVRVSTSASDRPTNTLTPNTTRASMRRCHGIQLEGEDRSGTGL